MSKITPFLWFDSQLEEAIELYGRVFPDVRIVSRHDGPDGKLFWGEFEVAGTRFMGMNAGPHHQFNEAVSFFIDCADQAEVDHYWSGLTADGGQESQCGWLKDKFGVSWQVVPNAAMESTVYGPDPEGAQRAMQAMLSMQKLDVAALEAAYRGE
jgi:predicted 3-demethylubiquinone-9 3-methyltransferase (glyoxalase superfamily)